MAARFHGSNPALITPFNNGKVDEAVLRKLVEWHISEGSHGLVPVGTTGESPTLTHDEHKLVVEIVVDQVAGRIPVIAGAGSNSTAEAVDFALHARQAGADAALSIVPYYNKPTQEGMYRHFRTVAESADIPIVIYNVPSRTGASITPETVMRLGKIENIVAIKEASGSLDQASAIVAGCEIEVLSGDDSLTLPIMSVGGTGVVSVVGNLVPADMAAMVDAYNAGDVAGAATCHKRLFPLCRAMFYETNPIPVKTAMKLLGRLNGQMRLPLCEMSEANEARLKDALADYGLISTLPGRAA